MESVPGQSGLQQKSCLGLGEKNEEKNPSNNNKNKTKDIKLWTRVKIFTINTTEGEC